MGGWRRETISRRSSLLSGGDRTHLPQGLQPGARRRRLRLDSLQLWARRQVQPSPGGVVALTSVRLSIQPGEPSGSTGGWASGEAAGSGSACPALGAHRPVSVHEEPGDPSPLQLEASDAPVPPDTPGREQAACRLVHHVVRRKRADHRRSQQHP
jgi:hypothetical protein